MLSTVDVSEAKVRTTPIAYTHDSVKLVGELAWDDAIQGKRPGVLVVHEWWGLNDYARKRARQLASMGYVAFAVDMYGEGRVTAHPDQAGAWMNEITRNIQLWRARAMKGLAILQQQPLVDPNRLAAIGYCFGGATVMQLVYMNAPVNGVVSFHGSLPLPEGPLTGIYPRILIAHGSADPFLTDEHIRAFQQAMDEANLDWQMIIYGGARHSFTNAGADAYGIDALKYDPRADARSWKHMHLFLEELFTQNR
ncbi:MAG: dienelactone hydrolase family protein [Nitrospirae bacterium]|nr:MAG: dienelactone hydrolase family protein [Nitrospirota bacterium]